MPVNLQVKIHLHKDDFVQNNLQSLLVYPKVKFMENIL